MSPSAATSMAVAARRGRRYPVPRPFVKWVGGKAQILAELRKRMPPEFGTYHEPFVGGGALFFATKPTRAVLSDGNERLIRAYRGVRDDVDGVIRRLRKMRNDKEFYLRIRSEPIDAARRDAAVAAWLIYLNKCGFNGLYRVNRRNGFNVPYGRNPNATICDEENLRACSARLRGVQLHHGDFAAVADRAEPGDFVYFDPPYVPVSATADFTSYTSDGFGMAEQIKLRDVALALKRNGVHVMLSNSASPIVRKLYREDFTLDRILATRAVNSRADRRGKVGELLIR